MEDVTSPDERHLVRDIDIVLFIIRVQSAAERVVIGDVDGWENVCLGKLEAQLARPTFAESVGREAIVFPHEPDPKFIDHSGADGPIIRELSAHVLYIPGGAVDGRHWAGRVNRSVVPGSRTGNAVMPSDIRVEAAKVLPLRGG